MKRRLNLFRQIIYTFYRCDRLSQMGGVPTPGIFCILTVIVFVLEFRVNSIYKPDMGLVYFMRDLFCIFSFIDII